MTACVLFLSNCSSSKYDRGEQIIEWINVQQRDSLYAVMGDDFSLTMSDLSQNQHKGAIYFLDEYLPIVKFMQGKMKIKGKQYKKEKRSEFYKFDVEFHSLYNKYLDTDIYKETVKMEFINNKLIDLDFDTTQGHRQQEKRFQEKFDRFREWMKTTHPEENIFNLFEERDPLYIERMKEYKKAN